MKLLTAFAILAILPALTVASDTSDDWSHNVTLPAGETATTLFNGQDLTGWHGIEEYFSVVDGQIRAANDEPVIRSTYLFTKSSYRNFRLLLEAKQTMGDRYSTMHSAVAPLGERMTDPGGDYGFSGPLLMFCHDWGIWGADGRGRVYPVDQKEPMANTTWEKKGKWNQLEILVVGNRIRMVANGKLVIDYEESPDRLKKGPIGLQLHNNKRPQEFHFRGLVLVEEPEDQLLTLNESK